MLGGESAAREHICSYTRLMLLNLLYRHPPAAHVHGHTRRQAALSNSGRISCFALLAASDAPNPLLE